MADQEQRAILVPLSDTDMTVIDPGEDIRGFKVVDQNGEDIGHVDDLLIDSEEKNVRFLQVAAGGFLGIGETRFVVPVDAIEKIGDDVVRINTTREHVMGAPQYDPEIAEQDYWNELYGYYGYAPYWGAGYTYPGFPFGR